MAKLTWDAVSAPNFGNPVDGIRTAAELFGRATASAKAGIDQFAAQRNQAAERAIMQRALAVSDPNELAKMQADGSLLGSEGQYASIDLLDKLSDRQGDLVTLANNQEILKGNQYKNKRTAETDANQDASRGAVFELFARANANDTKGVSEILANNPELAQLDLTTLGNLFKDTTNIQNTANSMANDNTRTGYEGERLGLDKKRTESQIARDELQNKVANYNLERAGIEDGREDITYTAKQSAGRGFIQNLPEMFDDMSASKQFIEFSKLSNDPEAVLEYIKLNQEAGYNPVKPVDVATLGKGRISDPTRLTLAQVDSLTSRIQDGISSRNVPFSLEEIEADSKDTRTALEIAGTMVGKGKVFPNSDATELAGVINEFAKANGIKPAQAARVLANNVEETSWYKNDDIADASFNTGTAKVDAENIRTGKLLIAAAANNASTATLNRIKAMSDNLVELEERLAGIERINSKMARDGKLDDSKADLTKRVEKLRNQLKGAIESTQKDTRLFRQN